LEKYRILVHFSHTVYSGSRNSWSSIVKELEYSFFQGLQTGAMDDQLFLPRDLKQTQKRTFFSLFYVILYCILRTISFFLRQNYVLYDVLLGATVDYF